MYILRYLILFIYSCFLCHSVFPTRLLSVSSWHKKEAQASMAATLLIFLKTCKYITISLTLWFLD